jgi:tetratricopeptide (TPR) repeat protein
LQSIGFQIQNLKTTPPPNEQSPVVDPVDFSQYTNLLQDGRSNQALVLLTKILEDGRVETKTKAQSIEAFAAQSPEKQYQTAFERLIPLIQSFESVWTEVALGRYFLNIRVLDRAQQHAETALNIDQNNKEALLLIASVDYAMELYLAGLEHAEKALALYPADPWCYLLVARGYRYRGMVDMAEIQILSGLEFALEGSEQNRLLCLEAASVYRAKGNEKEAQLWLKKSDQ